MTQRSVLFLIALAVTTIDCLADETKCGDDIPAFHFGRDSCQCGSALKNLTVATPKGMVLRAVCRLQEETPPGSGPYRPIDLRKEKVSLDKYTASGDYYWGTLYFAGPIVVKGLVRIQASDAGFLWFHPEASLAPYKSVFADSYYLVLKLDKEIPRKLFGLPESTSDPRWFTSTCSRATATIRLHAIEVELSEQDSAGAYAVGVEVLSHSNFKKEKCPQ